VIGCLIAFLGGRRQTWIQATLHPQNNAIGSSWHRHNDARWVDSLDDGVAAAAAIVADYCIGLALWTVPRDVAEQPLR
jgi:hypothetical protein